MSKKKPIKKKREKSRENLDLLGKKIKLMVLNAYNGYTGKKLLASHFLLALSKEIKARPKRIDPQLGVPGSNDGTMDCSAIL
jgi:hypothetical protein